MQYQLEVFKSKSPKKIHWPQAYSHVKVFSLVSFLSVMGFFSLFFLDKKYNNIGGPKSVHIIQASRPKIIISIYATNLCDHVSVPSFC